MRRPTSTLLALLALAACGPAAEPLSPRPPIPPEIPLDAPAGAAAIADDAASSARIAADVAYLASPELAGRGTGDPGAKMAADFVAARFGELKLTPLGERGYLQEFSARVGAKVAPAHLARNDKLASAPADLRTADGSSSGKAEGDAVFVGYGITAPAVGWDDYAGGKLEGKIAVVLDGTAHIGAVPASKPGERPPSDPLRDFGSVRYKLRTAREHKAAGVVLIAAGEDLPPPPSDAAGMGLPAVMVKRSLARVLFPGVGVDVKGLWTPAKSGKPAPLPRARLTVTTQIDPVLAATWNVAGLLAARPGSPAASETVVVGAHYDHLGWGGTSASRAPGVRAIHPGADDNASGTALLLEVARRVAALTQAPDRNILFLSFGGEELGTLGSRHWIEHPTTPLDRVVAMINADMVGRLRDDRLTVDGVGTAAGWKPLIDAAAQGLGFEIAFGAEGFGASDHASFTAARVPVAFFFTGSHEDYHLPSDTADKINAAGEARVATLVARLTLGVAASKERLAFIDAPADPHRGARGGFKVSLGTIPDYGFNGKGVRLDGVRPDAPASRAGMKGGDVIVKVGTHEITNIHDYMFALGELEPGRAVVVEVERDGRRVPLEIVPAPGR